MRTPRLKVVAGIAAVAVTALLIGAAPALAAADGIRVIPTAMPAANLSQIQPDVSGDFVAYVQGSIPPTDVGEIVLKSLTSDSPPLQLTSNGATLKSMAPRVLVNAGTIYVVWQTVTLSPPWGSDIWIWQGAYVAGSYVAADASFPKILVSGNDAGASWDVNNPSIGLVKVNTGDNVWVAWEDHRDNGAFVPLAYALNLTADTSYQDPSWIGDGLVGQGLDTTDLLARGQQAPEVGYDGIYWLDNRWTFWNMGALMDTTVWRATVDPDTGWLNSGEVFWNETNHAYDNGYDWGGGGGPKTIPGGALWLRTGPYGEGNYQLFAKGTGVSGFLTGAVRPLSPDAWYLPRSSSAGYTFAAKHNDSAAEFVENDIFFYDPATHARVPVCDYGFASPSSSAYFLRDQMWPAIGPATWGYRVVWADPRNSAPGAGEDSTDLRLYQAFVPMISIKAMRPSFLLGGKLTITATVAPGFAGEKVRLERVKPFTRFQKTFYKSPRQLSTVKTLSANSTATFSYKPPAKGTYWVRVYFYGATKYGVDGETPELTSPDRAVPTVANYSKVIKIVVK